MTSCTIILTPAPVCVSWLGCTLTERTTKKLPVVHNGLNIPLLFGVLSRDWLRDRDWVVVRVRVLVLVLVKVRVAYAKAHHVRKDTPHKTHIERTCVCTLSHVRARAHTHTYSTTHTAHLIAALVLVLVLVLVWRVVGLPLAALNFLL